MASLSVKIAVVPSNRALEDAVREGGASLSAPEGADAIVWGDPFHPEVLRDLLRGSPAKWVQLPFAGIERFVEAGVITPDRTWTCAKDIYGAACAELAVGLIVLGARQLHSHARLNAWWRGDDEHKHRRLDGTRAVIVGTGGIGRELASMLAPLGVSCAGVNRSGRDAAGFAETFAVSSLSSLAREADWLVIAAAATPETHHLVDRALLSVLKPDCWIINVARGSLVDQDALVEHLRAHPSAGAALDVTDPEPLPDDHALWTLGNAIITSHTANTFDMALPELRALVRRNVERFVKGEQLEGLVDPALGY
ncbi:MAG: D-isomer specific 2-hydroxyacid dehydrogenase family protein [Actinomycetota bacterium]